MLEPVIFGDTDLFGILHMPEETKTDLGVLFFNSGILPTPGPFGLYIELAELFTELGFPCLRIDQSGKGESPSQPGDQNAAILKDYRAASAMLSEQGVNRVVVAGLCSGADDAMVLISDVQDIAGMILFDPHAPRNKKFYANHYLPRLFKFSVWSNLIRNRLFRSKQAGGAISLPNNAAALRNWQDDAAMLDLYRQGIANETQLLAIFTDGVTEYYNHPRQLSNALGSAASSPFFEEIHYPGTEHIYPNPSDRDRLQADLKAWITAL